MTSLEDSPAPSLPLKVKSKSPKSLKRKRASQDENNPKKKPAVSQASKHEQKSKESGVIRKSGIDEAFTMMDGRLLSDYLAQRTRDFEKHLSMVELEDRYIPEKAFRDTISWEKPRNLDNLPDYLEHFSEKRNEEEGLAWAPTAKGTPHTIFITGAGLRAADLTRALRKFRTKDVPVAKLFAKHIKLKEAEQFVRGSRIGIAVGTPARVSDLINAGALLVDKLERVVVDSSYIDQKKRNIFDMRETFVPLMELLSRSELKVRYGASDDRLDLLFY
ncbi:MAG: hypothetical protein M1816_000728 [Peltula sp. TS41687]|nr:MAG: hypothetical protein M1816_000728 [Peltula sp. TS41687]